MKIQLLDIDEFIKKNNVKQVLNSNINVREVLDKDGLWSEEIFGRIGSDERNYRFGYIDLKIKVIHPEIYNIMKVTLKHFNNIVSENEKYIIDKDGKLILDDNGETGISFIIQNIDQINFELNCTPDKREEAEFINNNKDKILIDKWLILPAGIRDISLKSNKSQTIAEINQYYSELITLTQAISGEFVSDMSMYNSVINKIHEVLLKILNWVLTNLKGKRGLLRGALLNKSVDFSARLVIVGDPNVKLGNIGVPWNVVLCLYEPYFINYVLHKNEILKQALMTYLNKQSIDYNEVKNFSLTLNLHPEIITGQLKELLMAAAKDIAAGKNILFKRDPVVTKSSWRSAEIEVVDGNTARLSLLDTSPLGADFDGDTIALIPLLTKDAEEEAKMLNPKYNKNMYFNGESYNSTEYSIKLDGLSTLYAVTEV